jgi:hypothetical protein
VKLIEPSGLARKSKTRESQPSAAPDLTIRPGFRHARLVQEASDLGRGAIGEVDLC